MVTDHMFLLLKLYLMLDISMQKTLIKVCEMIYVNSDRVLSHKNIVKAHKIRSVNEAVLCGDNQRA